MDMATVVIIRDANMQSKTIYMILHPSFMASLTALRPSGLEVLLLVLQDPAELVYLGLVHTTLVCCSVAVL